MAMVVKPLLALSCSLVIVLAIVGVVMAGTHEVALALFVSILFLSSSSAALMLAAKIVRGSGHSKYQVGYVRMKLNESGTCCIRR